MDLESKFLYPGSMFFMPHTIAQDVHDKSFKRHRYIRGRNKGHSQCERIKFSLVNRETYHNTLTVRIFHSKLWAMSLLQVQDEQGAMKACAQTLYPDTLPSEGKKGANKYPWLNLEEG